MSAIGDLAASLGFPAFPCGLHKRPIVEGGFHSASADPDAIRAMFDAPAAKMIGIPTGASTGLVVIDVDIRDGAKGDEWLRDHEDALPETRTHRTQSGGLHLVFKMPDADIRNSASRIAPGVDVRGTGGYVIWPGSPGYSVADAHEPAEMPRWLIRACMPAEAPAPVSRPQERHEKYTQAAIDGEVLAVMRAPEGTRNDALNKAAVKLGTLVAAGQMARATAEAELTRAAQMAGLEAREIAATIRSGLDFGTQRPREMPAQVRIEKPQSSAGLQGSKAPKEEDQVQAPEPGPRIKIEMFYDISPALQTNDLIEGLLGAAAMSVVYGESNSGKTFFALDLALHKACGWEWRGLHVDQGAVIYCCLEGAHGIRNRVSAFKEAHGLAGQSIPFGIVTVPLDLCQSDDDTDALIEAIQAKAAEIGLPVSWVIMDTLARAMAGGNENAPDDMGALVRNGDRIRSATGAHLTWIHHSGKDQARGARGHSSLRAATDTEIEVINADGARTARATKQREYECTGEYGFALKVIELGENQRGKQVTSCVVEAAEAGPGSAPAKSSKLSKNAAMGVRALHLALDKCGAYLPALPEYPDRTFAASASVWRDEFYQLMSGPENNKRTYFARAETDLVSGNVVTQRNGFVWLVKQGKPAE